MDQLIKFSKGTLLGCGKGGVLVRPWACHHSVSCGWVTDVVNTSRTHPSWMGSNNTRRAVMGCIGEPTALYPVNGPNFEFISRFLDQSLGISAAWFLWYENAIHSDAPMVS